MMVRMFERDGKDVRGFFNFSIFRSSLFVRKVYGSSENEIKKWLFQAKLHLKKGIKGTDCFVIFSNF